MVIFAVKYRFSGFHENFHFRENKCRILIAKMEACREKKIFRFSINYSWKLKQSEDIRENINVLTIFAIMTFREI